MRVLWVVNIALPEASLLMGEKTSPYGGWLVNASKQLVKQHNVELYIFFPSKKADDKTAFKGESIHYFPFKPINRYLSPSSMEAHILLRKLQEINPDIVHIYGTELPHSHLLAKLSSKSKVPFVVSIQGLVSVCAKHMNANLPFHIINGFTLGNILRKDSIRQHKNILRYRGIKEVETLKLAEHVIGRTTWDEANTKLVNNNVVYHYCNETLRQEFYEHSWNIDNVESYSIFTSQGQYPIKGLHYLLEAFYLIKKSYPTSKLYVSGKNIIDGNTIIQKIMMSYYGRYIRRKIQKLKLESSVIFLGPLNENEMRKQFQKSHVFVCPSTIENSPNSLGEAMILGLPCVASFVGGIPDMLEHQSEGFLYPADAPYMLAHYVKRIFFDNDLATKFSIKARQKAMITHDRSNNAYQLMQIYTKILN